ncbi:MAG TPA: hypothetical protein VFS20_04175 [Longimicrobium sp.]|nr:hypothetical protein [Longimicrobium sp.]
MQPWRRNWILSMGASRWRLIAWVLLTCVASALGFAAGITRDEPGETLIQGMSWAASIYLMSLVLAIGVGLPLAFRLRAYMRWNAQLLREMEAEATGNS